MADPNTPLCDLLNRSGIPFQLAVEHKIRTIGPHYGVNVVGREVPWANGFVDVVAEKYVTGEAFKILFVFECKRVDDKPWVFVPSKNQGDNEGRCRLEWFNRKAPVPPRPSPGHSRVFCAEWHMCEGSPESEFCIVQKGTPIGSLEAVCRELLSACHHLLADEEITHKGEVPVVVPVVITTAKLHICQFDPAVIAPETGKLNVSDGQYVEADFVRFRKSLVTERSRSESYISPDMVLESWAADRERTVFVLTPSALERFL
jgi:hypothetical protein